jgi:hypothetical protein
LAMTVDPPKDLVGTGGTTGAMAMMFHTGNARYIPALNLSKRRETSGCPSVKCPGMGGYVRLGRSVGGDLPIPEAWG